MIMGKKMNIGRVSVAVALLLVLACGSAFAEGLSYIPCECGDQPCTCFLQLLDQGPIIGKVVSLLWQQRYIAAKTTAQFTSEVQAATIRFQAAHDLPATGIWDDATLTLIVWGMTPQELDETMPPVAGMPETYPDMCYVPSDGGIKRHNKPECSDMYDPRKVSIRNAAALGFEACALCEKARENALAAKYRPDQSEADETRQAEITYIVNTSSRKFHYPDCSGAKSIKEKNRVETTCSREDLIEQGYQPCGICHP